MKTFPKTLFSTLFIISIILCSCSNHSQTTESAPSVNASRTVLLVDLSGSMIDPDETGVAKMDGARSAINQLLDLINLINQTGNSGYQSQVGLVTFNNTVVHTLEPSTNLGPIRSTIAQANPDGGTNMSAGLAASIELLNRSDRQARKSIILLSDGIPTITLDGNEEIDDQQVIAQEVKDINWGTIDNQICLFTIGFGNITSPDDAEFGDALLSDLANQSGCGKSFRARESNQLESVFLDVWHASNGKILLNENYAAAGSQFNPSWKFEVPSRQANLFITVTSGDTNLSVTLQDRKGTLYTMASPALTSARSGNTLLVMIHEPQNGDWDMKIQGVDGSAPVSDYAVKVSSQPLPKTFLSSPWGILIILLVLLIIGVGIYLLINRKEWIESGKLKTVLSGLFSFSSHKSGQPADEFPRKKAFIALTIFTTLIAAAVVILYLRDRTPGEAETEAPVIPPQTITDTPYYDITITHTVTLTATPTPDNAPHDKIVYSCQVDRQTSHDQICLMNADGTNNRQLTDNLKAIHFYPSLSPDGNSIVFISSRAGGFEIFEMQIDGSNLRQLTSGIGECYAPEISPDGSKIVFTRFNGGRNTISVINRDGSGLTDLNNYLDCKDPTWSPDGSQILFIASPSQVPQFFVMNADGSNPHQVTDISGLRGRSDWGVNGLMASYRGQTDQHNREIFFFGENTAPYNVTSGGDNLAPSFSPDGNWVTFMSYRDHFWESDGCEIYVMRISDGTTLRLTSNDYCDWQPRWGP